MVDLSDADAARGKTLYEQVGCMKCHEPTAKSALLTKSLADLAHGDWSHGCMAADESSRGDAPQFALKQDQRIAIRAFAKTDLSSLTRDAAPEFAERQIHSANCIACHTRDLEQDNWSKLAPRSRRFSRIFHLSRKPRWSRFDRC